MPFSASEDTRAVLAALGTIRPRSVLDVGVGYGKYGMLARELLDFLQGRYQRAEWETRIDGIEVFEAYRTPVWDFAYNTIHIGDARAVVPHLQRYDVALLLDVVEHFEKDEGIRLIDSLLDRARFVVISTPRVFMPQGIIFGNEAERHLSLWRRRDFARWRFRFHPGIVCGVAIVSRSEPPPRFWVPRSHLAWRIRWEAWRVGPKLLPLLPRKLKDFVKKLLKRV